MEIPVLQKIQRGLLEKRHNLTDWLTNAPSLKRQIHLGPVDETSVQTHIKMIDTALKKAEEQTLGLCEICHDYVDEGLLEMDYTARVCLEHLSEQERSQLEAELDFLKIVQQALMPQSVPAIPGVELGVFHRPAQIVSGDYFDFLNFRDGSHGLAIADAMGHGVSASMLMTSLQTALRTLVPDSESPVEVLQRVNRLFLHNSQFSTFVTAFLGHYNPIERSLTYSNAGHNSPLFFDKRLDRVAKLEPTGAAIGLIEEYRLETKTITLSQGDILLLYTDGVTEATDEREEAFGEARLSSIIQAQAHLSAGDLVQAIRQELQHFVDQRPLEDDTTILALKVF